MNNARASSPAYKAYPILRSNYESQAHMALTINKSIGYVSGRFRNPKALAFTANDQHYLLIGMGWKDTPENREKVFENGRQRGIDYQMLLEGKSDEE